MKKKGSFTRKEKTVIKAVGARMDALMREGYGDNIDKELRGTKDVKRYIENAAKKSAKEKKKED